MFGFFSWIFSLSTLGSAATKAGRKAAQWGTGGMLSVGLGLMGPLGWFARLAIGVGRMVIAAIRVITKIALRVIVKAVRAAAKMLMGALRMAGAAMMDDHPVWEFILFRHFDWKRALTSKEEFDAEIKRLEETVGEDADRNGIPDAYDEAVTTPEDDLLGIKYPREFLRENDYIRLRPRAVGALPQPVLFGSKGLVRDTWIDAAGAWARVKWNAFSRGEGRPSALHTANQMDLYKLGHVHDTHRVTI